MVRNRSIPNVDDDRLRHDLAELHRRYHTAEGLHAFDGPRRSLYDNGVKIGLIAAELVQRGNPAPDCRFCQPRPHHGSH
jgi:hypothetical protein